jgi:hypothetical protein
MYEPIVGSMYTSKLVAFNCYYRLCRLVVRVPSYRSQGLGSISGHYKKKKSSGSGMGPTQPREYN